MAIETIGDNAQEQPVTTALRNICRDYPAGGTVLRELLQNADDAGATSVRFVLDEQTYSTDEMIHEKLRQYQGPALLAYNNAEFTRADLENLRTIGNSQKLHDGSTTGRFGLGFNSVYNWTDSPSIISRERLLFLDPHREWSSGGPLYDFVHNSGDAAMKNHLAAFQKIVQAPDQNFGGTVIRIPLRTAQQATKSLILPRETTIPEIRQVLQSFANEYGVNGLLFMKNVGKLEIEMAGMAIVIGIGNGEIVRSHKVKVNDAVKRALNDPQYSFDDCFEVGIVYSASGTTKQETKFIVHHTIQGNSMSDDVREWAKSQKLLPWVAVAAQVTPDSEQSINGSLFTVLPLPILNSQSVHIHGLFSLSRDRARLHHVNDQNAQDLIPAKWNNFLFQYPISSAWARLLVQMASIYSNQPPFKHWPRAVGDARDIFSKSLHNVLRLIDEESLVVWPSNAGFVAVSGGLLATDVVSDYLKDALLHSGAPVVYCTQELQPEARLLFRNRILCPETLCDFLKTNRQRVRLWDERTKLAIADYLLSKPGFTAYDGLEIFPFEDGSYQAIGDRAVFLHRDGSEKELFCLAKHRSIYLEKLDISTQQNLKDGCNLSTLHSSIQYRSARALKEYCMQEIFNDVPQDQNMVQMSPKSAAFVSKIWNWISLRGISMLNDDVSCLWLFPLSNGYHRRIKQQSIPLQVYLAPPGDIGKLMWKVDSEATRKPCPLMKATPTSEELPCVAMLQKNPTLMSLVCVANAGNLVTFLQWLQRTSPLDDSVADEDKSLVAKLITLSLLPDLTAGERTDITAILRDLKIFKQISWDLSGSKMVPLLSWTSLNMCTVSIGLLDGVIPVPQIIDTQFLEAGSSEPFRELLLKTGLVKCLGSIQVIQDHIIPSWENGSATSWTSHSKEQLATFILKNFFSLTIKSQAKLQQIAFVPVAMLNGKSTSQFTVAAKLIDPEIPELRNLYFDNECVAPKRSFLQDFNHALKACGLKTAIDDMVVENRTACYSNSSYSLSDRIDYAQRLLTSTYPRRSPLSKQFSSIVRNSAWLPAVDISGTLSLKSAQDCRSLSDYSLISSQLSTLRFPISDEWIKRLGWDAPLSIQSLLQQLAFGIEQKDRTIVDAVLNRVSLMDVIDQHKRDLKLLSCIVTDSGQFIKPSHAFRPCKIPSQRCDYLQPYLANVENKFWEDHEKLLGKLEIRYLPQMTDLLNTQNVLESKSKLDEADIRVAIEILNHAIRFSRADLTDLKVITASGKFERLEDVNFDDLSHQTPRQNVLLAHPDVPHRTLKKLGIVGLRELLIKRMLDIDDAIDEDEFNQQEDVTTRIRDTLDRYPVEATFREYLANADDAQGATKLSWLLDTRNHSSEDLFTPEVEILQGPALLVHNDGIFSDEDFEGFKRVGEGSKVQNREAIGQFGRGSQTMYHWTDHPMILSGKFLVILDPQQTLLPTNKYTGQRKSGVKLLLSRLREVCPNQLASFEGLWAYTKSLDSYPGTIFRFPLRATCTESKIAANKMQLNTSEVCRLMDIYFQEARISLLFLRKIRSIDFSIDAIPGSGWSVTRQPPMDENANKVFSELVICSYTKDMNSNTSLAGKDRWWVVIQDLDPEPENSEISPRRVAKNMECGLAALLPSPSVESAISSSKPIQSRMFNTLPLPIDSDLPVHVHATFSLTGDRQSITIGEYGTQSHASANQYYLQDALPKLYLQFLEDIGRQVRQEVFEYWPQAKPSRRSPSELLWSSFWEILPASTRLLFPKAQTSESKGRRQAATMFTFSDAVFDFLIGSDSIPLLPLLLSLDVNLVRNVPRQVAASVKKLPGVKIVSGPVLRKLFKSPKSAPLLQRQMIQCPDVFEILARQMISEVEKLEDMDACWILPLANGSVVALKYLHSKNSKEPSYYVASDTTSKLFQFASGQLVTSAHASDLGLVLKDGNFNLQYLRLQHVEKLLQSKPSVSVPSPEGDKWLTEFWKYWNKEAESSLLLAKLDSSVFKLFRATRNGKDVYVSPANFYQIAAVIEPATPEHRNICRILPDLYIFDSEFMPKTLARDEESFNDRPSFVRLLRAIRLLASPNDIGTFIEAHLKTSDKIVLRKLAIYHISDGILEDKHERSPDIRAGLTSLPLWPSFDDHSETSFLCAKNALMTTNNSLLTPWMKTSHRFVDPRFSNISSNQNCLLKMGVQKLSVDVLLEKHVLPLPSSLVGTNWQPYVDLIRTLSSISSQQTNVNTYSSLLKQGSIAVDGNGTLVEACSLYDHEDDMFSKAFRHQNNTRFLNEEIRRWRPFWIEMGLRCQHGGDVTAVDYLECLRVLALRLSQKDVVIDPHLEQDCVVVFSPLTTSESRNRKFDKNDWQKLSQEKVFPPRTTFRAEPEYRKDRMIAVASKANLLSLTQIVSYSHVAICWSQIPFPVHQPAAEVLNQVHLKGKPSLGTVWVHLDYMKDLCEHLKAHEVKDFLNDLFLIYDFLELEENTVILKGFSLVKNKAIWLNLDSIDHKDVCLKDITMSWCSIEKLVLSSSCDAHPMKAVRPGLMRYEKLLKALGCAYVFQPIIERPKIHHGYSVSNSLRKLKSEGKMLDVTLSTEGEQIRAHRVVLAAASQKCASQFSGIWKSEDVIDCDDGDLFISYHALLKMVNHAYGVENDWEEVTVSEHDSVEKRTEKLDKLLDVLQGADYWMMPDLKSEVEDRILMAGKAFRSLENIVNVWERATEIRAFGVGKMCADFIAQNKTLLKVIHGEEKIDGILLESK